MPRLDPNALTLWITAAATRHPGTLATELMARTGASRAACHAALRKLVEMNWLVREGTKRRPAYRPGLLRQVVRRYPLAGLTEDRPWAQDFAPFFDLPREVARMTQHAFCELLNNSIDHSEGSHATVSLRQTPSHVQLLVSDDGRGVFDKLQDAFDLSDPQTAMLELSKGKLTSEPARHSGRGLFFTSRLADVFDLHANAAAFQRRDWEAQGSHGSGWKPGRAMARQGTSVYFGLALDTPRTLDSVLNAHSADGCGYGFERTIVPLRLVATDLAGLDSRAQARCVANRLAQFRHAEVDFGGVTHIGHSFADELFRVLAPQHAEVEIVPVNMAPRVAAMLAAVQAGD
jgi:anti-sigma regulatory factor (Ser/Thr protein kinase)